MTALQSSDCQTPASAYFRRPRVPMIDSPCINVCILNPAGDHCIGCGRSLTEIATWTNYSDTERARVMAALPARLLVLRAQPAAETGS